jgi:hypothetical protein
MENDLSLQAIIGDAEMLMFPSNLLPEQYQSKYYVMYFEYYLVLKT